MISLCAKVVLDRFRKLRKDTGGNVAIIFALAVVPIIVLTGSAVDYGHAIGVRAKIQAALDATALMVAQNTGTMTDDELQDLADQIFAVNYPGSTGVTITELKATVTGDELLMKAEADVDTYIMQLAGFQSVPVGAETEVVRTDDTFEIVLVLDNTGSMNTSKMDALKAASRTLTNDLFGADDTSTKLMMALVPFGPAVNVGTDNADASWMDTDGRSSVYYENFDEAAMKAAGLTRFDLYDRLDVSWSGCVESRPYPFDVNDTEPDYDNPDTLFVPTFAPDEPDTEDAKGIYPNSYLDDDVDDAETDEVKQENISKYKFGAAMSGGFGPNVICLTNPIVPLTNNKSTILTALNTMERTSTTNIAEGLMWGLRVISPQAPFTEGKAYGTVKNHKVIILLTDGRNDPGSFYKEANINKNSYGTWGYAPSGRLIDTHDNYTYYLKMNERTLEACDAVKAEGIDLYTITFEVHDLDKPTMVACASSGMDYDSPTTDQLDDVFEEIAARLNVLRISK